MKISSGYNLYHFFIQFGKQFSDCFRLTESIKSLKHDNLFQITNPKGRK